MNEISMESRAFVSRVERTANSILAGRYKATEAQRKLAIDLSEIGKEIRHLTENFIDYFSDGSFIEIECIDCPIIIFNDVDKNIVLDESNVIYALDQCDTFEKFFISVCKIKDLFLKSKDPIENIIDFLHAIEWYGDLFSGIHDLYQFIFTEAFFCDIKSIRLRKGHVPEKNYQQRLIDNFSEIFPEYDYVGSEICVEYVGRIDILAKEKVTKRPVIIELKIKDRNPNKQLLAYATNFINPILIGITEIPIKRKINGIEYLIFDELLTNEMRTWEN